MPCQIRKWSWQEKKKAHPWKQLVSKSWWHFQRKTECSGGCPETSRSPQSGPHRFTVPFHGVTWDRQTPPALWILTLSLMRCVLPSVLQPHFIHYVLRYRAELCTRQSWEEPSPNYTQRPGTQVLLLATMQECLFTLCATCEPPPQLGKPKNGIHVLRPMWPHWHPWGSSIENT